MSEAVGLREVLMRVIGEIPHPQCKISIFSWNGKYLLKFEQSTCEQIYKIAELDVDSLNSLRSMIDEPFIRRVLARFEEMNLDLTDLVARP